MGDVVYITGRVARVEEIKAFAASLTERGWKVQARWMAGVGKVIPDYAVEAQNRAADVVGADVVVVFTEDPARTGGRETMRMPAPSTKTRGGRHVEFGMALALHKRIIVVGLTENVHYHLPTVTVVPSPAAALALLNKAP